MTTPQAKAQCPKCATELDEEFGMITCPGCGSVLFIDFEGQAQLAAEDVSSNLGEARGPATQVAEDIAQPSIETYNENIGEQNQAFDTLGEPNFGEAAYDNSAVDEAVVESFANYESMSPTAGEIAVEPRGDGVFEAPADSYSEPEPMSQTETDDGPLDISSYANSEASQAKEGPLTYTLHIEGLDSKELRESLREALSESRFAWDPGALMATIREGKMRLKAVEPVKASVLVNRLKRLPLKIWWEQNVVTDSKP